MSTKNLKLDQEEKEILDAIAKDSIVSVGIDKKEIARLKEIANNTLSKTKAISIRISERDLLNLKFIAAEEGIPYQTLISSTLHKRVRERK